MSDLRTGGQGVSEAGYRGLGMFLGLVAGLAVLALTVGMIGLDIYLGPQFLYAQAKTNGVPLDFWGKVIPWVFSFATTGLLYALWQRPTGEGKQGRYIRLIAYFITIADTLVDVAGFNSILYNDPHAGEQILLPSGAPLSHWFFDIIVGLVCLLHEPLLAIVLGRYQHKVNLNGEDSLGDRLEAGLVYLAGWILNVIKVIAVVIGAVAMMALDIALTPQSNFAGVSWVWVLIVSGLGTALQVTVWRFYVHVRQRDGLKSLGRLAQGLLAGSAAIMVIDTVFDMKGYNNILTGSNDLLPPNPTPAWLLVFIMVAVMCTMNEALNNEIFRPLGRKSSGGDADFGGGPGGDADFGGGPGGDADFGGSPGGGADFGGSLEGETI